MSQMQGIPEQDKPENQDPDVAYSVDGMTGEKVPFGEEPKEAEAPEPTEPTREKNPPPKGSSGDKPAKGEGK